ncbi:MAG: SRPBCC family protein [Dongiaceae bacterium]
MSHDGMILDPHTVEFKRLLPGPIELAWDYLTKPELLKTWFNDVTMEPRVGGAIEVRFSDGNGDCGAVSVQGVIREYRKPHVFAFSWNQQRPQADGSYRFVDEGEVRFELKAQGDKVLLTLLHSRVPTQELPNYGGGWHAYLDCLESRISGGGRIDVMEVYRGLKPGYADKVATAQRAGAA